MARVVGLKITAMYIVVHIVQTTSPGFNKVIPTVWTSGYVGMTVDPKGSETPYLYIINSGPEVIRAWINVNVNVIPLHLAPNTTEKWSMNALIPDSSLVGRYGFSVVASSDVVVFYKDALAYYQLPEVAQLGTDYVIDTPRDDSLMLCFLSILSLFDSTSVTVTFPSNVNVNNTLIGLDPNSYANDGQIVTFPNVSHRDVVKLQSYDKLTGTLVTTSRSVMIVAGSHDDDRAFTDVAVPLGAQGENFVLHGYPLINVDYVILAITANTTVIFSSENDITLVEPGDSYTIAVSEANATSITALVPVDVTLIGLYPSYASKGDSVHISPTSQWVTHFIVNAIGDFNCLTVTVTTDGVASLVLDDQHLAVDWNTVQGATGYRYTHVNVTQGIHVIQSLDNTPFEAVLVTYVIQQSKTFMTALLPSRNDTKPTDHLQVALLSDCKESKDKKKVKVETTSVDVHVDPGHRYISYDIKHLNTTHLQACQAFCLTYEQCVGVNFGASEIDMNCDLVMKGNFVLLQGDTWTFYLLLTGDKKKSKLPKLSL